MSGIACLHGFTGSPESWNLVVELLDDQVVTCRPRLGGHGIPPQPVSTSFEAEVERIGLAIRESFVEPVHLCGYSMGARLGLGLLLDYPDLFSAATLVGVHAGLEDETARRNRRKEDEDLAVLLEREDLAGFVSEWEKRPLFGSQKNLDRRLLEWQRGIRLENQGEGLASAMRILGLGSMPNYWIRLGELKVSTTLIVGELDAKFTEIALRISAAALETRAQIAPRTGHNVVLEAPEIVASALSNGGRSRKASS